MIYTSELRIGNYINLNYGSLKDDIRSIIGCNESGVFVKIRGCEKAYSYKPSSTIYPIPLSEEVVLKCGFKLNKENTLFEHSKCGLRLMDIVGLYYRANFPIKADVTSIHQLQNLYYALCGRELEVSL